MKVPEEAVGKRVRCKACEQVFTVPDEDGPKATAKPAVAKPLPADMQKKPAMAKPVVEEPPPPANAPIGFADDDEDDGKDYGVIGVLAPEFRFAFLGRADILCAARR